MNMENRYIFTTDSVHYQVVENKSTGEKDYFITGYISTSDLDIYNDIVTEKGLKSMFEQLKSKTIKLDYDHEAWRDSPNILPVGKIIESRIDSKGLWVKAELNDASPKFKSLWKSIRKGFVDAFSIAFKPITVVTKNINGVTVRLLDNVELLNVALTGVPVNSHAKITDVMMKALLENSEVKTMTEQEVKSEEQPIEESQEEVVEKVESTESAEEEESKEEVVEEKSNVIIEEMKSMKEAFEKEIKELKGKISELEKTPVMKSIPEDMPITAQQEMKSIISQIR